MAATLTSATVSVNGTAVATQSVSAAGATSLSSFVFASAGQVPVGDHPAGQLLHVDLLEVNPPHGNHVLVQKWSDRPRPRLLRAGGFTGLAVGLRVLLAGLRGRAAAVARLIAPDPDGN